MMARFILSLVQHDEVVGELALVAWEDGVKTCFFVPDEAFILEEVEFKIVTRSASGGKSGREFVDCILEEDLPCVCDVTKRINFRCSKIIDSITGDQVDY